MVMRLSTPMAGAVAATAPHPHEPRRIFGDALQSAEERQTT
jgi:hypothetical protein